MAEDFHQKRRRWKNADMQKLRSLEGGEKWRCGKLIYIYLSKPYPFLY
jgi:hypothetical protein